MSMSFAGNSRASLCSLLLHVIDKFSFTVQCLSAVTEENDPGIDLLMNSKHSISQLIEILDNFAETTKDLVIASTASGLFVL